MEIKNNNDFNGLYGTKRYMKDTEIYKLVGDIVNKPTRTSIEIGPDIHIEDDKGRFMNHSFDPSCKIHNGFIYSIKDLEIGDELTFNYNSSETSMSCPFVDTKTQQTVSGIVTADNK